MFIITVILIMKTILSCVVCDSGFNNEHTLSELYKIVRGEKCTHIFRESKEKHNGNIMIKFSLHTYIYLNDFYFLFFYFSFLQYHTSCTADGEQEKVIWEK